MLVVPLISGNCIIHLNCYIVEAVVLLEGNFVSSISGLYYRVYVLLKCFILCLAEEVPVGEYTLPLSKAEVVTPG